MMLIILFKHFIFYKSIMIIALILLVSCAIVSFMIIIQSINPWVSFLLIITFITGIIILFIYIITTIEKSIEKKFSLKLNIIVIILIFRTQQTKIQWTNIESNFCIYSIYKILPIIIVIIIITLTLVPTKRIIRHLKTIKTS